jgi:hypothetical protein
MPHGVTHVRKHHAAWLVFRGLFQQLPSFFSVLYQKKHSFSFSILKNTVSLRRTLSFCGALKGAFATPKESPVRLLTPTMAGGQGSLTY